MLKLHLDTDIGGDMDDFCALAMLLKWPNLEITGVTTVAEEQGRRAGYAHYVLNLMGRGDIPVAAGANVSDGYYRYPRLGYPSDEENWPEPIPHRPGSIEVALDLMKNSIEQGAVLVGIGPFTNFRLLDEKYPGILKYAQLVLMGGYVYPIPEGFPAWTNQDDWNMQVDVASAKYVLEHSSPTLVPLTITVQTALRRAYLARLGQAGRLGELIVRQAELFARMAGNEQKYGETCSGLPRDIINFQHDPFACAIALGWRDGIEIERIPLKFEVQEGWLQERIDSAGTLTPIVTKINAEKFNQFWWDLICVQ